MPVLGFFLFGPRSLIHLRFIGDTLLARCPATNGAFAQVMVTRGTIFSSEVDNLQVQVVPQLSGKEFLEVLFGMVCGFAATEPPT